MSSSHRKVVTIARSYRNRSHSAFPFRAPPPHSRCPSTLAASPAAPRQGEASMFVRLIELCSTFLFASILIASSPVLAGDDGIVAVKSAYSIGETVDRLKKDIADK